MTEKRKKSLAILQTIEIFIVLSALTKIEK